MKKYYIINYQPNKFKASLDPEFTISFAGGQIFSIIFTLANNMFVEDLIGALTFILFPITLFTIFLFAMFLLSRFKLTFNYKEMKFIKRTIFTKKTYNMNKLKFEQKYITCKANNQDLLKIFILFEGDLIAKIDANSFENVTGFKIDAILE